MKELLHRLVVFREVQIILALLIQPCEELITASDLRNIVQHLLAFRNQAASRIQRLIPVILVFQTG